MMKMAFNHSANYQQNVYFSSLEKFIPALLHSYGAMSMPKGINPSQMIYPVDLVVFSTPLNGVHEGEGVKFSQTGKKNQNFVDNFQKYQNRFRSYEALG